MCSTKTGPTILLTQTIELVELRAVGEMDDDSEGPDATGFVSNEGVQNITDKEASTILQHRDRSEPEEDNTGLALDELDSSLSFNPKEITAYPKWSQISTDRRETFVLGLTFDFLAL